jgi:hypothetical protein
MNLPIRLSNNRRYFIILHIVFFVFSPFSKDSHKYTSNSKISKNRPPLAPLLLAPRWNVLAQAPCPRRRRRRVDGDVAAGSTPIVLAPRQLAPSSDFNLNTVKFTMRWACWNYFHPMVNIKTLPKFWCPSHNKIRVQVMLIYSFLCPSHGKIR